jgi:hypothetical protein
LSLKKIRLNIEIEFIKLFQQKQSLPLDKLRHIKRSFLLFRHHSVSAPC